MPKIPPKNQAERPFVIAQETSEENQRKTPNIALRPFQYEI
jgi:hypothetical protein